MLLRRFGASSALRRSVRSALSSASRSQSKMHSHALRDLLNSEHYSIINDERDLLGGLHGALSALEVSRDSLDLVADTRARIDDLFMMVIVGEFNAGKSTFINSLLGAEYLKCGVLPTTDKICLLRSGKPKSTQDACDDDTMHSRGTHNFLMDDVEDITVPTEWLRSVAVIDTPGTNALLSRHEELTSQIVPRADLVLFVTSAEKPLSDSEAAFLDKISQWGKKIIVIINKMDMLPNDEARKEVEDFVRIHVAARLRRVGTREPIPLFPLSARLALSAKLRLDDDDQKGLLESPEWRRSGVADLENHLRATLASSTVIASKLSNPLGVCDRLIAEQLQLLRQRQDTLVADMRTVELLHENSRAFEDDVARDAKYAKDRVNILIAQQKVALNTWLKEELVQGALASLLDMSNIKGQLARVTALDLDTAFQETIADLTELVSARSQAQSRTILQYVGDRHKTNDRAKQFIGELSPISNHRLDEASRELRNRLQNRCQEVLKEAEIDRPERMASALSSIQAGFTQLAALHASTILGMGCLGYYGPMLDVTTELPASILALSIPIALSTFVLPRVQDRIQSTFDLRAKKIQTQIETSIETVLEQELRTVIELIGASIKPYERFVDYEKRTTDEMILTLESLKNDARRLRHRLDHLKD